MRTQYLTRDDYHAPQRHQLPPMEIGGIKFPAIMVGGTHPYGMRWQYERPWKSILEAMAKLQTPLLPGSTIGFVGTGFGWEVEVAIGLGYQAVGIETSPYIESVKDTSYEAEYRAAVAEVKVDGKPLDPDTGSGAILLAEWLEEPRTKATILNVDIGSRDGLNTVTDSLGVARGQKLDWAISANVLPVLDDQEAKDMNDAMFILAQNVCHYTPIGLLLDGSGDFRPGGSQTGTVQRTDFNWKSLMAWKALLTDQQQGHAPKVMRTVQVIYPAQDRLTVEQA